MGNIPREYLPSKNFLPEKIYALPEVRYPSRLNLSKVLLDDNIEERGEKVAIYYKDEQLTYRELQKRVDKVANALRKIGIEKGDRIMLRAPNSPEYIISNFACWRIGAIPVLVSHLVRSDEIIFRANDSEAKVIIVHSGFYDDVEKAQGKCKTINEIVVIGEKKPGCLSYKALLEHNQSEIFPEDTSKEDIGRLIYSSGTTGLPKGIISTNADLLSVTDTHARYVLGLREDDVIGGHPYMTFAFGSVNFTLYPWRFGASLSIIDRFTPEGMLELVEKHKITVLCCVPTAFRMMLNVEDVEKKYNLNSLRLCQSAGEWLPGSVFTEWKKRFNIEIIDSLGSGDLMYWLSTRVGLPESKVGSTGIPVPGFENKIVDENFNEVHRGQIGELLVRGPAGQQYWRRSDKQKEGVYKGWNRPGLVYMEDEDGYFWYKGRSDDMIVSAGYKIPSGEVENALNEHPAVLEAAVVDSPDAVRGSVVKAFIVLREGYQESEELIKELQEFVKEMIEPYKYPRLIEFKKADEVPRTSTHKIQRNVLRKMEHRRYKESKRN